MKRPKIPTYGHHKSTGQARVYIGERSIYQDQRTASMGPCFRSTEDNAILLKRKNGIRRVKQHSPDHGFFRSHHLLVS